MKRLSSYCGGLLIAGILVFSLPSQSLAALITLFPSSSSGGVFRFPRTSVNTSDTFNFDPSRHVDGYLYEELDPSKPGFASVLFPGKLPKGHTYDLYRFDNGSPVFLASILHDTEYSFVNNLGFSLDRFMVLGLTPLKLNPNVLDFSTHIKFANDGFSEMQMTALPVPEPGTFVLFGTVLLGLVSFGWYRRKK